jgi:hypothetical protein
MSKSAIFSSALALLVVVLVLLIVLFAPKNNTPDTSAGLSISNGSIVVSKQYQTCLIDSDCTTASVRCDSCECGTPIATKYQAEARTMYDKMCKGYQGAVCDMYCAPLVLKCENKLCVKQTAAESN